MRNLETEKLNAESYKKDDLKKRTSLISNFMILGAFAFTATAGGVMASGTLGLTENTGSPKERLLYRLRKIEKALYYPNM